MHANTSARGYEISSCSYKCCIDSISRKLRVRGRFIICICITLLGLYVAFIISSLARHFETYDPPNGPRVCALFSAVLEYFSVAYFCWVVAEALFIEKKVSNIIFVVISLICWSKWLTLINMSAVCVCVCSLAFAGLKGKLAGERIH